MPQFLLGLFFGTLFTGAEVAGALLLLPFVLAALIALAWGAYEGVIWFDASQAAYEPAAWYAWPWHWPGAHVSAEFLAVFGVDVGRGATGSLAQFAALPARVFLAGVAVAINLTIAMVPLVLLGRGIALVRWVLEGQRKTRSN